MGRAPCCDKANVKKGPWAPEEDSKLKEYIEKHGTGGNWIALPQKAGLKRCGKSCRLRWLNYLRPNIKHGDFSDEEDKVICSLFANIGSRWSIIAAHLPGRTDNDIKNYWNTKLKKKLLAMAPQAHQRKPPPPLPSSLHTPNTTFSPPFLGGSFSYFPNSKSLTGFAQIPTSSLLSTTNSSLPFQTQEDLLSPMQYCPVVKDNLLSFGSEASCSSNSDGRGCSQISYGVIQKSLQTGGGEIKQEDMGGFQSYNISDGFEVNHHKFMLTYGNNNNNNGDCNGSDGCENNLNSQLWAEKRNGFLAETPLDYDLVDVKELISTNNNSNNFFVDENKTQEKQQLMYYYNY